MIDAFFLIAQSAPERRGQLIGLLLGSIATTVVGLVLLRRSKRKK